MQKNKRIINKNTKKPDYVRQFAAVYAAVAVGWEWGYETASVAKITSCRCKQPPQIG